MTIVSFPDAFANFDRVRKAGKLVRGAFREEGCVCALGAAEPGARSLEDCANAGWPEWQAAAIMLLYDCGEDDEEAADFAAEVFAACGRPYDAENARTLRRHAQGNVFAAERLEARRRDLINAIKESRV